MILQKKVQIKTWKQFAKKVRSRGCNLLSSLNQYPNSIFVAGCQRSGTTAIANIITTSDGMINYWTGKDSELDAALLLSGNSSYEENGRYCFQTTYLNECVEEYLKYISEYKLIWIVRNPYSVVCSMLNNWGNFAFNELFESCGAKLLLPEEVKKYKKFGCFTIPKVKRACLSYNVKTLQVLMLKDKIPDNDLLIVDYDQLISNPKVNLEKIYNFINLEFNEKYVDKIRTSSLKKHQKLTGRQRKYISNLCMEPYDKVKSLSI